MLTHRTPPQPVDAHAPTPRERPSKTQLKRDMHELQQLGAALTELGDDRLAALALPEPLAEALHAFRGTRSHEGRRRQMQYIGKLMRGTDALPIREAVAASQLGVARDALALHEAEGWRDALLASDDAIGGWMAEHPDSDVQRLRSLLRAARKDAYAAGNANTSASAGRGEAPRKGRAFRELFQFIKQDHAA